VFFVKTFLEPLVAATVPALETEAAYDDGVALGVALGGSPDDVLVDPSALVGKGDTSSFWPPDTTFEAATLVLRPTPPLTGDTLEPGAFLLSGAGLVAAAARGGRPGGRLSGATNCDAAALPLPLSPVFSGFVVASKSNEEKNKS